MRVNRFFALAFVVLTIVCGAADEARALPPNHSAHCLALLMGLRQEHSDPSVSVESTLSALQRVTDFRQRQLPKKETSPTVLSLQDLWVESAKALPGDLLKIEEELSCLMLVPESGRFGREQSFLIAGSEIRGSEKIARFLDAVEVMTRQLNSYKKPHGFFDAIGSAMQYPIDIGAFVFFATFGEMTHQIMSHNYNHLPAFLAAVPNLVIAVKHANEIVKAQNWSAARNRASVDRLLANGSKNRDWIFSSKLYTLPGGFADLFWTTDIDNSRFSLIARTMAWRHSRLTELIASMERLFSKRSRTEESQDLVAVDQLLSPDPQTGEPVLTVFVRLTSGAPPKGPGKKIRAAQRKEEADDLFGAIPAKVR